MLDRIGRRARAAVGKPEVLGRSRGGTRAGVGTGELRRHRAGRLVHAAEVHTEDQHHHVAPSRQQARRKGRGALDGRHRRGQLLGQGQALVADRRSCMRRPETSTAGPRSTMPCGGTSPRASSPARSPEATSPPRRRQQRRRRSRARRQSCCRAHPATHRPPRPRRARPCPRRWESQPGSSRTTGGRASPTPALASSCGAMSPAASSSTRNPGHRGSTARGRPLRRWPGRPRERGRPRRCAAGRGRIATSRRRRTPDRGGRRPARRRRERPLAGQLRQVGRSQEHRRVGVRAVEHAGCRRGRRARCARVRPARSARHGQHRHHHRHTDDAQGASPPTGCIPCGPSTGHGSPPRSVAATLPRPVSRYRSAWRRLARRA